MTNDVMTDLPIHAVLPKIRAALAGEGAGVLIAPPVAGRPTAVAPALLGRLEMPDRRRARRQEGEERGDDESELHAT